MNIRTYLEANNITQSEFADRIGVTTGFINQMLSGLRPIPAKQVIPIEKATNGEVTRHELRPDIYPIEN